MARLRPHPRSPFGAINVSFGWFGRESTAGCRHRHLNGHDPTSPDPTCSCGFYSVTRDAYYPEPLMVNQVRLDVELAGRVMIHGMGYRSEWQRVLGVRVPPCFVCGRRRDAVHHARKLNELFFLCAVCGDSLRTPHSFLLGHTSTLGRAETLFPIPLAPVRELLPVGFTLEGEKRGSE